MAALRHLHDELQSSPRVTVQTRYGLVTGGRAVSGAAVFLEVPYALPPGRFRDPQPLPDDFRYEEKAYIRESAYAVQPLLDRQSADTPVKHRLGYGEPSENPLFVNIACPPSFPANTGLPVKIYLHGGFLQYGSPHGLGSQAQYVSAARDEVWVNIGYRLSAFGFLACDEPKVGGNFGFKDMWCALEWVRGNIAAFGGDPGDVTLTGLSAGAHACHQLMHHVSRLPPGIDSPFQHVRLESNAIITTPKTQDQLRPQFYALCTAVGLDASLPPAELLASLSDPAQTPARTITDAIDAGKLGAFGTFRGCLDGAFLPSPSAAAADSMAWQRSGSLARALRAKGVRSVTVGHVKEEWYLYGIADPLLSPSDIRTNLLRYYPESVVDRLLEFYPGWEEARGEEGLLRAYGEVLSDGQVHLPTRLLARDLVGGGMPVVRYEVRWVPPALRNKGYITHGTDRALWAFREPFLEPDELATARAWLDAIDVAVVDAESGRGKEDVRQVLLLKDDRSIGWGDDDRWERLMQVRKALPGED